MKTHIVIDGNAFYEVDEECLKKREQSQYLKKQQRKDRKTMTRRKKIRTDKKKKRYVPEIRHVPSLVKREF